MPEAILLAGKPIMHPISPPFFQDAFRKPVHAYPSLEACVYFQNPHMSKYVSRHAHQHLDFPGQSSVVKHLWWTGDEHSTCTAVSLLHGVWDFLQTLLESIQPCRQQATSFPSTSTTRTPVCLAARHVHTQPGD